MQSEPFHLNVTLDLIVRTVSITSPNHNQLGYHEIYGCVLGLTTDGVMTSAVKVFVFVAQCTLRDTLLCIFKYQNKASSSSFISPKLQTT